MQGDTLRTLGLRNAQRAIDAGGTLVKITAPYYEGTVLYTHIVYSVQGRRYRVSHPVVMNLRLPTERGKLKCAASACPGCTVCDQTSESSVPNASWKIKFGKWEFSEDEINRQIEEASIAGEASELLEPTATDAYLDPITDRIVVELDSGVVLSIPYYKIQGLEKASLLDVREIKLNHQGTALRWERLDIDMSVAGFVVGIFGTKAFMKRTTSS